MHKGIITVAGGKGGTGKTFVTANLGTALAQIGHKVIIVDADFGGSDLNQFMSIKRPKHSLSNILLNENKELEEILIDTGTDNLKMIACGALVYGTANMHFFKKFDLMNRIKKLEADYIILDIGAGTSFNTIDFFNLSDQGILVLNFNPVSRQNALVFLQTSLYRKLIQTIRKNKRVWKKIEVYLKEEKRGAFNIDFVLQWIIENSEQLVQVLRELLFSYRPKVLFNKIEEHDLTNGSVEESFNSIMQTARNSLQIDVDYLGAIRNDPHVELSLRSGDTFLANNLDSAASQDIFRICLEKISDMGPAFLEASGRVNKNG